jgi:1,4-alpha-glucan branching enzyme
MWLGECGYVPGIDEILREAAIRYFFVDTHGILFADSRPQYGVYAPLYCPSGVAAFGRDIESSEQVWSAQEGYPGDKHYRDFYRDIGFDLPMDYIKPYIHPEGHRMYTGIKYHAITHNQLHDKWVYDPDIARGKVGLHASHFRGNREKQAQRLRPHMDRPPIIVSPYDAELYGHWWFEGPMFLDFLARKIAYDQRGVQLSTPADYLAQYPVNAVGEPSPSSWGDGGYSAVWVDGANDWVYRHVHRAEARMHELARAYRDGADDLKRRALNQAARELLLAQSSDWAFIMKTATAVRYACDRVKAHLARFRRIDRELSAGFVDEGWLADLERRDNIFPEIDYRVYA